MHYGPLDPRAGLTWFEFIGLMLVLIPTLWLAAMIGIELETGKPAKQTIDRLLAR